MYKKASQLKKRFLTSKGSLSVEQLWDLSIPLLDELAISLEKDYKASGDKSFITTKTKKDKELKLSFDIVLDVLNTKIENGDKASKALKNKIHNQKILAIIANIDEKELKGKTKEELLKLLK
tara:strand:+ start:329 stop:694 length:366 start_codon:yes stop_codon:yes gene_type:complete